MVIIFLYKKLNVLLEILVPRYYPQGVKIGLLSNAGQ